MRAAREGEGVARLRSAHPPREVLPEGNPARAKCADHQHAREDEPQQDRREDRLRLALFERRGPAIRPAPAHGRDESEGEEVRERGDHACALELVRRADDKVGYQERAICTLYDEREDDAGELDEELDDMGLYGEIEHGGEEVDKGAGDRTTA